MHLNFVNSMYLRVFPEEIMYLGEGRETLKSFREETSGGKTDKLLMYEVLKNYVKIIIVYF